MTASASARDWRTGRYPLTSEDVDNMAVLAERLGLDTPHSADRLRAMLVRVIDLVGPVAPLARAIANALDVDPLDVYVENFPRKAAKYAAACRERGDHPHADRLHAALVALMFCANCGRPLVDPISIDRGIGPDCWPRIAQEWRLSITRRMEAA